MNCSSAAFEAMLIHIAAKKSMSRRGPTVRIPVSASSQKDSKTLNSALFNLNRDAAGQRRGRSFPCPGLGWPDSASLRRTWPGPDPEHPQIPLLGTEADTPLGERENFAGFPLTPRTGWWEGPRSGTSRASRSSMAHAWPGHGPGRPRRGAPSGHPQQSLNPPARPGACEPS